MAGGGEAFGAEKEETPNETTVEFRDNSEAKKLDKQKFSHFCSFFLIPLFYVIGEAHHVANAGGIVRAPWLIWTVRWLFVSFSWIYLLILILFRI